MAKQIVRESKFRHVFSEELMKEKYEDLRPSSKPSESTGIKVNGTFLALAWDSGGGGTIAVLPLEKTGRLKGDLSLITGHRGAVLDWEWYPFNDNLLLSASEDLTLKLWQIPDGGLKEHLKEPLVNFEGHGKKVMFCTWNRSAGNIFASTAFDLKTMIWNVEEQGTCFSIDMPDQVWSMKWNYTGSLLATSSKDKKMRIIDPRTAKFVTEGEVHSGSKAAKVEWLGRPGQTDDDHKIVTTGFSKQAERQIAIWDLRKFGDGQDPMNLLVLDTGTGALYPTYDAGTGMAYFAGKGDGNVRYFEVTPDADPFIHFINTASSKNAQKGFDWMPKHTMDTSKHEVMRGMKLESNAILPISFRVPRKAETFQEDIFPDAPSTMPAMSAEEWQGGAECKEPKTMSMDPGKAGGPARKQSEAAPAIVSVKDLKKQLSDAQARIKELEDENAKLKEQLAAKS